MHRKKKIALVVVAHNEERLITATLEKAPKFVDKIFVIDDVSTDSTADKIRARKKKDPRIQLISHEVNTGPGGAVI